MINFLKFERLIGLFLLISCSLLLGYNLAIMDIPSVVLFVALCGINVWTINDITNQIFYIRFTDILEQLRNEMLQAEIDKLLNSLKSK